MRPPGPSVARSAGSARSSCSSSWFTTIRSAWNSRAKSDGPDRAPRASRIAFTKSLLVAKGAVARRLTTARARRRARGSSARSANAPASRSSGQVFRMSAAEPRARRLARAVVRRRVTAPFATSDDFVNAIREARGARSGPSDFARLFQALRIVVNQELEQLDLALPALRATLGPGGRMAVITYHSGEDRIVKHAFRDWSRSCVCPPRQPVCTCRGRPLGRLLTRKPIRPGPAEVRENPRARSAQLRAFEVTGGDAAS